MLLLASEAAAEYAPWCASWFCQTYKDAQGANPSHIVFMMVPFFLTVTFVYHVAVKPLIHVLEEREKKTVGARDEATELEGKFNERFAAYEARVSAARQQASDERARIRKAAGQEEEKLLNAARDEAAKAVEDVRRAVEAERQKARAELRGQAEALARELAAKALGREVAGGDVSGGGASRGGARAGVPS